MRRAPAPAGAQAAGDELWQNPSAECRLLVVCGTSALERDTLWKAFRASKCRHCQVKCAITNVHSMQRNGTITDHFSN